MAEPQEKSVIESDSKEKIGNTLNSWTYSTDSSSTMDTGVIQGTGDKG